MDLDGVHLFGPIGDIVKALSDPDAIAEYDELSN